MIPWPILRLMFWPSPGNIGWKYFDGLQGIGYRSEWKTSIDCHHTMTPEWRGVFVPFPPCSAANIVVFCHIWHDWNWWVDVHISLRENHMGELFWPKPGPYIWSFHKVTVWISWREISLFDLVIERLRTVNPITNHCFPECTRSKTVRDDQVPVPWCGSLLGVAVCGDKLTLLPRFHEHERTFTEHWCCNSNIEYHHQQCNDPSQCRWLCSLGRPWMHPLNAWIPPHMET